MRSLALLSFVLIAAACGSKQETEQTTEPTSDNVSQQEHLCFLHLQKKDTVKMTLRIVGESISGDLAYNLYEKDRNNGSIRGTVAGDTIFARYTFNSEGVQSVREVAFLRNGNTLTEGYGALDDSGTTFLNRRDINFSGIVLKETACTE